MWQGELDDTLKQNSEISLENISSENQIHDANLEGIVKFARSVDSEKQAKAVELIKMMYSKDDIPPLQDLIASGVIPILVDFLTRSENPNLQYETAWALSDIAYGTPEQAKEIVKAGAVPCLINLMKSAKLDVCEQAIWTLSNIVGEDPVIRDHVLGFGLVQELLKIINSDPPLPILRNVTWIIMNLCRGKPSEPHIEAMARLIPELGVLTHHTDTNVLINTSWAIAYLLESSDNKLLRISMASNIFNRLNSLLVHNDMIVQAAVLKAVGHIASNRIFSPFVINVGLLKHILERLDCKFSNILKYLLTTLNIIVSNCPEFTSILLKLDLITKIHDLVKSENTSSYLKDMMQIILHISCHRRTLSLTETNESDFELLSLLRDLLRLLKENDVDILEEVMWSLAYITEYNDETINIVAHNETIPEVVPYLSHNDASIQVAALRIIGNMASGNEEETEVIIRNGALQYFPSLLTQSSSIIRKETLWILSNILTGTEQQIQAVIDSGLIPIIIHHINWSDFSVQKEAVYAVYNLVQCGSNMQTECLINHSIVKLFCDMLTTSDSGVLETILLILEKFLESNKAESVDVPGMIMESRGLGKIEALRKHPDASVRQAAQGVVSWYLRNE